VEFDVRVSLVTGANRGIGAATACRLAGAGIKVAVGYGHDEQAAERVIEKIEASGGRAVAVACEVRDPSQVERMASEVESSLGPVDVLVSNAGIARTQTLEDITVEDWDGVMALNLRPAFLLAKRLTPGMRERGWGRMILVSSVAAFTGGIIGPHYAASKAALIGLAHALAGPLAPHGVTVNAIAPALVETEMLPGDADARDDLAGKIQVGRLGRPEEVAEAVYSVVSNPYVTAQTLSVDGGMYPR
jgi:3-oxoacyl-[acyl-carrier protein] reductase